MVRALWSLGMNFKINTYQFNNELVRKGLK